MKIFAAALMVATLAGFGAANAMPIAPAGVTANADIIQVSGGCGPRFFRGIDGLCHRKRRAVIVAPLYGRGIIPPYVVKRHCPPGYYLTPRGRCRIY